MTTFSLAGRWSAPAAAAVRPAVRKNFVFRTTGFEEFQEWNSVDSREEMTAFFTTCARSRGVSATASSAIRGTLVAASSKGEQHVNKPLVDVVPGLRCSTETFRRGRRSSRRGRAGLRARPSVRPNRSDRRQSAARLVWFDLQEPRVWFVERWLWESHRALSAVLASVR